MSKPILLFRAPVKSVSGYGAHSRDLLYCLYKMNIFDIKIDSCLWGVTPLTALEKDNDFHKWISNNIVTSLNGKPDFYVQVTVPNEFLPLGNFNIGITAGIETTAAPKEWIDGCNKMDLIITTSTFSKNVLASTAYNQIDKNTNTVIGQTKITKPIEVLFEGIDTAIFNNNYEDVGLKFREDFCFLFVGHWLKGVLGQDRKDVGMLIKTFAEAFKNDNDKPALVLKTSSATFSIKERESLRRRIEDLVIGIPNAPSIYLLFGEMTPKELNSLYNHPNIKSMISFTKGEGFGRPLLEFSMTGKPIIATNWSGHLDFLPKDKATLLGGKIGPVHESAVDKFIIKDSQWFTVNYEEAIMVMKEIRYNYAKMLPNAEKIRIENKDKFSLQNMRDSLYSLLEPHLTISTEKKIKLPKLTKIG